MARKAGTWVFREDTPYHLTLRTKHGTATAWRNTESQWFLTISTTALSQKKSQRLGQKLLSVIAEIKDSEE